MLNTFPRSGPLSTAGYAPPTSSGLVTLTPLTGFLDTRWQRSALEAAERARAATLTTPSCILKAKTVDGLLGSLFPNADATLLRGFGPAGAALDLRALGQALDTMGGSLDQTISNLAASVSLQSLASGLGRVVSNSAAAVSQLLDRALSAVNGDHFLGLAEQLLASTAGTLEKIAGAVQRSALGQFAMGQVGIGDLLSGVTGAFARTLDQAGVAIEDGLRELVDIGSAGLEMAGDLLAAGVDALVAPLMTLSDLAARLPSLAASIPGRLAGLGRSLLGLAGAALRSLGATIQGAFGRIGAAFNGGLERMQGLLTGALQTFERLELANVIDGHMFDLGRELSRVAKSIFGFVAESVRDLSGVSLGDATDVIIAAALGRGVPVFGSGPLLGEHGYDSENFQSFMGNTFTTLADACAFNAALSAAITSLRRSWADRGTLDELFASLECRRSTYDRFSLTLGDRSRVANDLLQQLSGLRTLLEGGWLPPDCDIGSGVLGGCA